MKFIFIRQSSDVTYYVMALTVRGTVFRTFFRNGCMYSVGIWLHILPFCDLKDLKGKQHFPDFFSVTV